jgi:hypothetical protein
MSGAREFGWLLAFSDGNHAGIMELGVPTDIRKKVYGMAGELKDG